jgi:hypothetical protein
MISSTLAEFCTPDIPHLVETHLDGIKTLIDPCEARVDTFELRVDIRRQKADENGIKSIGAR